MPQSKPPRSGKVVGVFDRASGKFTTNADEDSSARIENPVLISLKNVIATGDHRLDSMLGMIADAARQMTGANGAALAMWRDGAMECRARSGEIAPPLGAKLSAETGISGECLRSGQPQNCTDTENNTLVDVEVCRSLGLRSIAVLPIQGWRGVNGILEVFSTRPHAFSTGHMELLQQLAALAERARAACPHGASSTAPKIAAEQPVNPAPGLLPASDRVGDVALAFVGKRSRPLVLGIIGLVAASLLALMIWLGWRGPGESGRAQAATSTVTAVHPPDNDPVWRLNPGGQAMLPNGKPAPGSPIMSSVKSAAKVDKVSGQKSAKGGKTPLLAGLGDEVARDAAMTPVSDPHADETASNASESTGNQSSGSNPVEKESAVVDPPRPVVEALNLPAPKPSVAALSVPVPAASLPVSRGVSGGKILRRVPPVYPAQARLMRLEGTVTLAAMIMEDGSVHDVRVIEGSPALAQAAVEAVKRWKYEPFALDGKPVKNETRISVDFKMPSDAR